ncbi:glycosyltransferase family 2 protein [Ruegeria arenilitoris]|uniref:glycosyltransferase family 2 protein n=1 Tax=Ruegeria arenilitoris TaxID=1173585 RepID=UPI00147BE2C5|nr:glycosyltransferase family 2 protein [Ruegeria arenilitoris]
MPKSAGLTDHYTTFFAGSAQLAWHPYREARGFSDPEVLMTAAADWFDQIGLEIVRHRPRALLLTMADMWTWCDSPKALNTFLNALSRFSDDIRAVVHLARPEDALCQHFIWQVLAGRVSGLSREAELAQSPNDWWGAAHVQRQNWLQSGADIRSAVHTPSPGLDQGAMLDFWRKAFEPSYLHLRPLPAVFTHESLLAEFRTAFDLKARVGKIDPTFRLDEPAYPSRLFTQRLLRLNLELIDVERRLDLGHIPHRMRRQIISRVQAPAQEAPLRPEDFAPLVQGIETEDLFSPSPKPHAPVSIEPDDDFDPSPLLVGFEQAVRDRMSQIRDRRVRRKSEAEARLEASAKVGLTLSADGARLLTHQSRELLAGIRHNRFAPRNHGVVSFDEAQDMPPLPVDPPAPSTGTLIVGCMKDEAPYILEWIAFHKSIGVDHFLIFTNNCSDGTDAILDRLAELGHVTHENNDEWKGKSPQQAALNKAVKMDIFKHATWLIHIDVDEYINVRFGNGTLAEVYAADPDTTNIAMTWRVFGNAGIDEIGDASVIRRFTQCAPAYAPKPHTMWGFKTATKNVGIYSKLSCHRPNKPFDELEVRPKWLNGSLCDITDEGHKPGTWRSSIRSVGYDKVQLNHYALRSRDSFIVKRKRGRALHTTRTIGFNYWVRHDWNTHVDRTILRHMDRMEHEKAKLLKDPVLAELHANGLVWHRSRATELGREAEFRKLRADIKSANLTDLERVAYTIAADMES